MQDLAYTLQFESLIGFCQRQTVRYKANYELMQLAVMNQVLDQDAPLYIIPRPERRMVMLALPLPFKVPAERFPHVGECVTRLNSASYMGTWVLNVATGEVYFRVSLPTLEVKYTDESLLFVFRLCVSTVNEAARGVQRVAFDGQVSADIWPTDFGV